MTMLLICLLVCGGAFGWFYMCLAVPDRLKLIVREEGSFRFPLPSCVTFESESEEVALGNGSNIPEGKLRLQPAAPVRLYGEKKGSYHVGMKLFGVIRMKDIQVEVVDSSFAIPCGLPVGIYMRSDGIMVIGTGEVEDEAGNVVEPCLGILRSGDYIERVNGKKVSGKEELIREVGMADGKTVRLGIRRDGDLKEVELTPVLCQDGSYKMGAWVRDDTQGIGTVTYVDPKGGFGALGHGISDSDTGRLVDIEGGELYDTKILGIEKGMPGKPGVLSGVIYYGRGTGLGTVDANTEEGIFGTVDTRFLSGLQADEIPVAYCQQIHKGQAQIRSAVSGEVRDYDIEIQKVDYSGLHKNKGMVLRVVDEELLALTGGIVQGMSGSPIIQDGKLIGAVTHVLVNDPARGYGIFIENMLSH